MSVMKIWDGEKWYPIQTIKGDKGDTGATGQTGADGHTPVITAEKSGRELTIYVDGEVLAIVDDGQDGTNGTNGQDGADGHTPVVTASKSGKVTTVSVDGSAIATINDGEDGADGDSGVHYGSSAPSGDENVWIDPTGNPDPIVTDVKINGSSIVSGGEAVIPIADGSVLGVARFKSSYGVGVLSNGDAVIYAAGSTSVKAGANSYYPITPTKQHESVFYGLAKAAGADMASSDNAVGTYTDAAKAAIRKLFGLPQEWELIHDSTTTQDLAELSITVDNYGAAFELTEMYTEVFLPASTTGNTDYIKGATYATLSNGNNPSWQSLTTLKYTNASKGFFEYHHELICGICRVQSRGGSSENNSQNTQSMVFPGEDSQDIATVESLNGIRWQQYNNTSTLIPSGTRVKIYGRRKV